MTSAKKNVNQSKPWELLIYIAGQTPRSEKALANLRRLCEEYIKDRFHIEVIDLLEKPESAETHQIFAIPTVVRNKPTPIRKIIGDLSDSERVIEGLEFK